MKDVQNRISKDSLYLIYMDMCGLMPASSLTGARYYMGFLDDHFHWYEVGFLKSKVELDVTGCNC